MTHGALKYIKKKNSGNADFFMIMQMKRDDTQTIGLFIYYGVATMSGRLKMIGLFGRISSLS